MGPLALPGDNFKLAFTSGLARQIFVDSGKVTQAELGKILADEGKYVHSQDDANWWIPSGRVFFGVNADVAHPASTAAQELAEAKKHFFLPRKFTDPFGQRTTVDYDDRNLLVVKTQDALTNTVSAQNDYRVLQPRLLTDPNGNRSEVAFDALGLVVGTAVMGKEHEPDGQAKGDKLGHDFNANLDPKEIEDFFNAERPHEPAVKLLGEASTRILYNLDCFKDGGRPAFAATLARETHATDPLPPGGLKIQISFSYSDGFGREIQKKIQAEP